MKKLLTTSLLALGALALSAAPSFASGNAFGLFTCSNCCFDMGCYCLWQYNAFSPILVRPITCGEPAGWVVDGHGGGPCDGHPADPGCVAPGQAIHAGAVKTPPQATAAVPPAAPPYALAHPGYYPAPYPARSWPTPGWGAPAPYAYPPGTPGR